ncbi:hypothetical protein JTE90_019811 [Oedothorax gibbosus]|uniref:Uncharacterized protein n=1 Tax=Oedothorax gibbosus TaxID=931172 RepID=A0AAV6V8E4_9ARAC|nr:hypothetical protein JTE90_019811 [Oedothorax gibbosus]
MILHVQILKKSAYPNSKNRPRQRSLAKPGALSSKSKGRPAGVRPCFFPAARRAGPALDPQRATPRGREKMQGPVSSVLDHHHPTNDSDKSPNTLTFLPQPKDSSSHSTQLILLSTNMQFSVNFIDVFGPLHSSFTLIGCVSGAYERSRLNGGGCLYLFCRILLR